MPSWPYGPAGLSGPYGIPAPKPKVGKQLGQGLCPR